MNMNLANLANATPAALQAGDWRIIAATLARAKQELEASTGGRQSWMDGALGIAQERALTQQLPSQQANHVPQIVVCMEGGLITSVMSAEPIALAVIDYDTECAEAAALCNIPQGDGTFVAGHAWVRPAEVDSERTEELVAAVLLQSPVNAEEEHEAPSP